MLKAKDIMTTEVITVSPSTTVEELAKIFIDHRISGAPVVGDGGELIGIVTENDLIRRNKRLHIPTVIRIFDLLIPIEGESRIENEIKRITAKTVSDICIREVVTIGEDSTIQDISTIMAERNMHLLPVIAGGKIVGIVGKIDIIRGAVRNE